MSTPQTSSLVEERLRALGKSLETAFNRYDYDHSNAINSAEEAQQLTLNVTFALNLPTKAEDIDSIVKARDWDAEPLDMAAYAAWFDGQFLQGATMSFTVVCPQGVALRNTPSFNDRNQGVPGPSVGQVLQGQVVPGQNGLNYLQTQQGFVGPVPSCAVLTVEAGFVPFYKEDGTVVLGPTDQVVSCQVTKDSGA